MAAVAGGEARGSCWCRAQIDAGREPGIGGAREAAGREAVERADAGREHGEAAVGRGALGEGSQFGLADDDRLAEPEQFGIALSAWVALCHRAKSALVAVGLPDTNPAAL